MSAGGANQSSATKLFDQVAWAGLRIEAMWNYFGRHDASFGADAIKFFI
jgi:hypothetical protein